MLSKQYGSYTDADLNDWQMLPENSRVLTSSAFGAWLLRRDERKGNRDLITELEKLKAEVQGLRHTESDTFDKVVRLDKLNNAIDTRIKELKGENK